ncbi:PREDICTED: mitochondrial ornithine transporter 1 [Nicrophorus vespilloides]|uniref:Mitochondrial ornithine transporter 1 n=1 Tax=Nicrophorus vespilloides TaxID=110193 RepID=A0ABM1MDR0_NICVS|nr:PREDICTED: mitochondrial ornithine transporter 1 [Nicrophorus vespilloides]
MTDGNDIQLKENYAKNGFIDFAAGFLGGVALVYVGQPLDTIKVKMQTFPHIHKNMITCFTDTFRKEGIYRGLYAGTVPALAANITENSILFLGYGFCQNFMQKLTRTEKVENLSIVSNATAGCLASFFSSIALTPTELIKCKLQAMYEVQKEQASRGIHSEKIGPWRLTSDIIKMDGFRGLFRGLVATLVREMPGYFFFFGGYEGTRTMLCNNDQTKDDIGLLKTMFAGSVGGMVFWCVTYPVDVAKSRIQVNHLTEPLHTIIIRIARTEGFSALFNGLTPTLVRTVPATATLFVTYEYTKKFLHNVLD